MSIGNEMPLHGYLICGSHLEPDIMAQTPTRQCILSDNYFWVPSHGDKHHHCNLPVFVPPILDKSPQVM